MAAPYIRLDDNWNRPSKPPTKAAVAGWPFPQYAQVEGIAKNKYINKNVHNMAEPHIRSDDTWARRSTAPQKAEVAGWPYPQYA